MWSLMNKHVTHNRCHAAFADFKAAVLTFLHEEVPRKWHTHCDQTTDNFHIVRAGDRCISTVLMQRNPSFACSVARSIRLRDSWHHIRVAKATPRNYRSTYGGRGATV
jgi:hypothetical protein